MAQLKDLLVNGPSRFLNDVYLNSIQAHTTASGTTFGTGTDGQVLASNGTGIYWKSLPTSYTPTAHTHAWSEITSTPASYTPSAHTHGNISNTGAIATSVTIASDDKIVITDTSDSNKVTTSSLNGAANALINSLSTGSSALTANDYVITQYVGGGGTTITYHRRPASAIRVGGLLTARELKVNLNSTVTATFDGTANQTSIPISGTLGVAYGGTGATVAADARTNLEAEQAPYILTYQHTSSGWSMINDYTEWNTVFAVDAIAGRKIYLFIDDQVSHTQYYLHNMARLNSSGDVIAWDIFPYTNANDVTLKTAYIYAFVFRNTAADYNNNTYIHANEYVDFAALTHTHGNISNTGAISASVTIANNDRLVIQDNSDSGKITTSDIIFDGSTTNKYLTPKGTWQTITSTQYTVQDTTLIISEVFANEDELR